MEFIQTEIPDVLIIKGKRFCDDRGFFSEMYKEKLFVDNQIPHFVQDNMSESKAGVVRGLHWQAEPFGQGKLVTCITGSIIDVAVDVRPNSPHYGKHVTVKLDSREAISLWVPVGFGHGFQSLEDATRVFYKVTNYWNKESERALNPLDPKLGIQWSQKEFILSEKDAEAPNFDAIMH
jgi:dTDP-4-dehydrorhamnose 3,5-epimerase